jgi:putative transposase
VASAIRDLIQQMCQANFLWGAPRIHGEILKLGIEVAPSTVGKYVRRHRKPPSQTWRTFLKNHMKQTASMDFRVEEIPVGCRLPLAVSTVSGFVPV